ncbi:fibrobacter succinogenes major paralogous domain-containing protein [Carboxylicivirga taeanensis]|uniref:fibrobacter succinogenes major paralogous domain-containing protein n=1 Tax=Carboxylicivirga taeanensis TaxID=1416875 RepID=UPI003F6DB86B
MKNTLFLLAIICSILYSCSKDSAEEPQQAETTVTDVDNNTYETVIIGEQIWMTENLKASKLNDGTSIPLVEISEDNITYPAYSFYKDDINYKDIYGPMYNWKTVETGKLCPDGWRVPTKQDWTILIDYVGGDDVASSKLREVGTLHWNNPNDGATDEYGFTALPGGYNSHGGSNYIGEWAKFWSSTQHESYQDESYSIVFEETRMFYTESDKELAYLNVRCMKDK